MATEKVVISQEEFNSWLAHPVTQVVRESFNQRAREIQVDWVNGAFTGPSAEETLQMNSAALSRARAYTFMAELELMDLEGLGS